MKKRGISLLTLIITVIIIVILAAAIVLTISRNNVIEESNDAVFKQNVSVIQDLFNLQISDIMLETKETPILYSDATYSQKVEDSVLINERNSNIGKIYYIAGTEKGCIVFGKNEQSKVNNIEIATSENINIPNIVYRYTEQELPIYTNGRADWYVTANYNIIVETKGGIIEPDKDMELDVINDIRYTIKEDNKLEVVSVLKNLNGVKAIQYKIDDGTWSEEYNINAPYILEVSDKDSVKVYARAVGEKENTYSNEFYQLILLKTLNASYTVYPGQEIVLFNDVEYSVVAANTNIVLDSENKKVKVSLDATTQDYSELKTVNDDTEYSLKFYVAPVISENEYQVSSEYDLKRLAVLINNGIEDTQNIILEEDIDLRSVCGDGIGSWEPIGNSSKPYTGTFNGNGKIIDNVYIDNNLDYQALFGENRGSISKVIVKGTILTEGQIIGGICAVNRGTIDNCENYVNITNSTTTKLVNGGICGGIYSGSIINCNNYGNIVTDYRGVGGIVGYTAGSSEFLIENCNNYGKITSNQGWGAGGIIGYTQSTGKIKNCINNKNADIYCAGSVAGGIVGTDLKSEKLEIENCKNYAYVKSDVWAVGGIIGDIAKFVEITNCINTGEIYGGNGNSGGIVGSIGSDNAEIYTSEISGCVNTGYVHASGKTGKPSVGGIVGTVQFGDSASVTNSYNRGTVAATEYTSGHIYHGAGGIVGTIYNNATSTSTKSKVTISNTYNTGNITNKYSTYYAGHIIGRDHNNNRSVTNSYYLSTASGKNNYGGTSKTDAELKKIKSTLGSAFVDDTGINAGYPILSWQKVVQ